MITNTPKTIEDHVSLIGTKWHIGEDVRVIVDIENLVATEQSVSGDIHWKGIGSSQPIRTTQLRFFRRWLKNAAPIDQELLTALYGSLVTSIEQCTDELTIIHEEMAKLNERKSALVDQLARAKSLKFIQDNALSLEQVQVLEEKYTFAHDNQKHYEWLKQRVTKEWFTVFGYIFKTSEFSISDLCDGSDGRYIELVLLAA
ncbi:hypothetical protein [Vibrio sp. Hal054]|uniref:hypothetical protein n=1 Tax=Vibrio sp. Hal054 TaxID=3035158 RepID=UPI00301DCE9E